MLITRPKHDKTTRYLYYWSEQVIEEAKKKGINVFDLKGRSANKKEFESRVKKLNPTFIYFNGHGDIDRITGHNNENLIEANSNVNILKDKIIYALSCQAANILGVESVKAGARVFIGYSADFIFCHDEHKISKPLSDNIAELFLGPSNQLAISLIKGNTAKQACDNSKKYYKKNIQKVLSSDSEDFNVGFAKFLWWDMKNQTCIGDENASF